jgi:Uma2 family endonuclease
MASLAAIDKPVLGLDSAGTLMTPREFDAIDRWDENYRYELIHGVLVVAALPLPMETGPNETLGVWLTNYQMQGGMLDGTLPEQYVRTTDSRRRADRLIWVGLGRYPNLKKDLPAVVVEFVSASKKDRRRDYVEKKKEYMDLGIGEYWIIDRFRRTLTVIRNLGSEYEEEVIPEKGIYKPALLPGFKLPLKKLLAVADAWSRSQVE